VLVMPGGFPAKSGTWKHRLMARVTYASGERPGIGWNAPVMAAWLRDSVERASTAQFGAAAMFAGLGGSIPFLSILGERFPRPSSWSPV
jgi:hypothetical protein